MYIFKVLKTYQLTSIMGFIWKLIFFVSITIYDTRCKTDWIFYDMKKYG